MNVRYRVELSQAERDQLTAMLRGGHHAARKLKRAQILLAADGGVSDAAIAAHVAVSESTVYRTKRRFVGGNLELSLSEEPRAAPPRKLSGKEEALLVATACSSPPQGRARWTLDPSSTLARGRSGLIPCVDGPWGSRRFDTGRLGVACAHVSGLSARLHDRWPRWVPQASAKQDCGLMWPQVLTACPACRRDRWSSCAGPKPRHRGAAQAATGWRRYTSPRAIIAHTTRAILLASATAASFRGLRASSASSQAETDGLPGLA